MVNFIKVFKIMYNENTTELYTKLLFLKKLNDTVEIDLTKVTYEKTYINLDKIIAISAQLKFSTKENLLCMKIYFNSSDFWTIKYDEYIEKLIKEHLHE